MAEHVKTAGICLILLGLLAAGVAQSAESVRLVQPVAPVAAGGAQGALSGGARALPALPYDPLRPPANLMPGHDVPAAKKETPLVLESVQTTGTRRVAVISGQRVMAGQSVRDYRVMSVDNRQAVLQGSQGRLVLWLAPALHGQAQSSAAKTDTTKQESAGVSEKTAPSNGERK